MLYAVVPGLLFLVPNAIGMLVQQAATPTLSWGGPSDLAGLAVGAILSGCWMLGLAGAWIARKIR